MSIEPSFRAELSVRFGQQVRFDERLDSYMAYNIGGPADALVFPVSETDLVWLGDASRRAGVGVTIVGTGTNLLIHDAGIRGVTVLLKDAFNEIAIVETNDNGVLVRCGGGALKPQLLEWACANGLTGLEFSSGVPGTIGGGIFMNAGTQYGSYGDILEELRLFTFSKGVQTVLRDKLTFGYRTQDAVKEAIVVWATFRLQPGSPDKIRAEIDRIIGERAKKQPLDYPSCGSTFRNPEGLSAGRLIERSGLKGLRIGGAEISQKHANFILNKGGATASDVLSLIEITRQVVKSQKGVSLETEVIVLGGP